MTTSFPPISYPNKPIPPFSAPAPRNPFPGFYPDMWRNIIGKPYITVSSKGLANGQSEYFNDGADFGPDSLQSNGSLTQTSGIQEASNYLLQNGGGKIIARAGVYLIDTTIFINSITATNGTLPHPTFYIEGEGANLAGGVQDYPVGVWIRPSNSFDTSAFGGWMMVTNFTDNSKISHIGFMGINPAGSIVASGLLSLGDYNIKISKNVFYNCVNGVWVTLSDNSGQIPIVEENQSVGCTNQAFTSESITINGTTYEAYAGDGGVSQGRFINNYDAASNISYWLHANANNGGNVQAIISENNISDGPISEGFHVFHHTLSINDHITIIASTQPNKNAIAIVLDNSPFNADHIKFVRFGVSTYLTTTDQSIIQTTGGTNTVDFELEDPYIYEFGTSTTNPIYNGTGIMKIIEGTITSNRAIIGTSATLIGKFLYYNYSSGNLMPLPITQPTLSTNPPVSGTVYQNTNPYDIEIDMPVYATTSGTAGYVTIAKGATSTPTAIGNQFVSGSTSSTSTDIIKLRVPAGWYYSFTGSGVTFATATPFAE